MPIPENLDDLLNQIKDLYLRGQYTVPGQAAEAVINELSLDDIRELVSRLNATGVRFDLRHDLHSSLALSADMPDYVLRRYLVKYFAEETYKDSVIGAEERRRMSGRTMRSGDMHIYVPMPVLGDDGVFYIPDPELGE